MTKRFMTIIIVIVMIFSIIPVTVSADNDILDYLTYEIIDGEVTITDCDESISGNVVIPDTIEGYPVTVIGEYAFDSCIALYDINLPDSITTIGRSAFSNSGITDIIIPASVENIGSYAFYDCTSLECITVDESNKNYYNDEYGVLFNKDVTELICYPSGNSRTSYNIPESVIIIGNSSFFHSINLSSVTIPDSVITVCADAFGSCSKLESVTIGNGLTTIGSWAFAFCAFETIDLPESLQFIDYTAFGYCFSLKSITIPSGVKVIPPSLFVGCFNLNEINFPNNLDFIDCAFDYCPSLKTVVIPDGTKEVIGYAFAWCPFMNEVYIYDLDVVLGECSFGYMTMEILTDYDTYMSAVEMYINDSDAYDNIRKYEKYLDDAKKIEDFTIHGYVGSTAEAYATEHGFKFVPICDHINTETINIAEADCVNDGYTGDMFCNDCKEIIENGETVPSAGHNYIENIIKAPTYSQDGLKNAICDMCGDTTAEEVIPKLTINNSEEKENTDTDISIIYPDGAFDGEIEVEVTPVEEGDAFKLISHKQGNYKVTMFDINVTVDGHKVQPNGTVLVKIPLPRGYNQNKCVVYYVADDGTMEELKTYHYKDGYVYFETDHFSYYAITEDIEESSDNESEISFIDRLIAFFKMIIDFFKQIFGIA